MPKVVLKLTGDAARRAAIREINAAPVGHVVTISEPKRSLDQNAKMWAMLGDISSQIVWHGKRLSQEDWKCLFSARARKEFLNIVPNIDNDGFVALGMKTSDMTIKEMATMIEIIQMFGDSNGVIWSSYDDF